jgi:cysteine desulfurase
VTHRIYLDNNATTQPDDAVIEATAAAMRAPFGNASSIHTFGQEARAAVESARRSLADLLGADTREIVFTSGGTESDNAAIAGVFRSGYRAGNHIVTTRIEHPAVLQTCRSLEAAGAEVTYLPVDASGRVDPEAVASALTERTVLVSVMLANNETGVIQPIREIADVVRARGIVLHTDGVQGVGKIPVDVGVLDVDLLSLSAHKFHGPKGVGALYVRKGTKLVPFMAGGSHERKRRAGTENVPGIVGLGVAARLAREHLPDMARVAAARDRLEQRLLGELPGVKVNGDAGFRLPNTTNLSFQGVEGEAAVIALDLQGVAVSTGSACSSGSLEPSHVLMAMGLRPEVVQGSLRFTFSRMNSAEDADRAVEAVKVVAVRLRGLARGRAGGR